MSAAGPGSFAAFLVLWVGMSAVMMLPSSAPTISLFALALARGDRERSATLSTAVLLVLVSLGAMNFVWMALVAFLVIAVGLLA